MTENEALFRIKDLEYECVNSTIHYYTDKDIPTLQIAQKVLEEIQQYRAIGTAAEFKELKEKNVAKEIYRLPMDDMCLYHENHCPKCDSLLVVRYKHCPKCGQKLDWQ